MRGSPPFAVGSASIEIAPSDIDGKRDPSSFMTDLLLYRNRDHVSFVEAGAGALGSSFGAAVQSWQHRAIASASACERRRYGASFDRSGGTAARAAAAPSQGSRDDRHPPRSAGRAAAQRGTGDCGQERELRSGAPGHRRADRGHFPQHRPSGHRGAAAGRQRHARQGAAAGAGRVTGFRRQRRTACAQRAWQSAIPHQRRRTSRRRRRLRANLRHRAGRQCLAADGRLARAIRTAHRRRRRYPDPDRRLQQLGQRRHLRRQPQHRHAELRIWRYRRANPVFLHRTLFRQRARP